MSAEIEDRLAEIRNRGLYRRMRCVSGPQGPRVLLDGRPVLLLCSNNYLGLADHPRVREAAAEAAMRYGAGAGASRLVSGNMTIHRRLEEQLAAFKRSESCLLFGSGYLANAGVISALAREGDVVFSDALNHASIIDGCRLSRAETFVYDHADSDHLEWGLRQAEGRGSLIVTDGVFSMDGDVAPLERLVDLAQRHDARMAKYLINSARTLIFSTALPPPAVAAAMSALGLLAEQPRRVEKLKRNGAVLRAALNDNGLPVASGETPIVPLIVGEASEAVRASERALERGIFAQAIRPPTVPEGSSRLRLAVMASHTKSELREAAQSLAAVVAAPAREAPPLAAEAERSG